MPNRLAPDWLTQSEYAHRGLHGDGRVENSRSAFDAAIAAGMGIECDIQLSRDRVAMVFHDWELERLTDGIGNVAERTAADLSAMHLKGCGDRIETLAQLADQIAGRVPLLVEIKSLPDFTIEQACAAVAEALADYTGPHAVMSFDPRMGAWFAAHDPGRVRGLVCTDTLDHGWLGAWRADGAIERADPDFLACDIRDLPNDLTTQWRAEGKPLLSWTIRDAELRAHALAHVDAMISEGAGLSESIALT